MWIMGRTDKAATGARWRGAGASEEIGGVAIQSPFFYVGSRLAAVHDTGGEVECALIDPSLEVDTANPTVGEPAPDAPVDLAYSHLTPLERGCLLRWLAAEDPPESSPAWLVRMQLFAIERRVLHDHQHDDLRGELPGLIGRLESLRSLPAVRADATLDAAISRLIVIIVGWPDAATLIRPSALDHRLAACSPSSAEAHIGWALRARSPIPSASIGAIVRDASPQLLPAEASICPVEFDALFEKRAIAAGLASRIDAHLITANERLEPLSPSFKLPITVAIDRIEQVDEAWLARCVSVASQCGAELSSFARWRRENPNDDATDAIHVLLPPELGGSPATALPLLVALLEERCGEQPFARVQVEELGLLWPLARSLTAPAAAYVDLVRFLDAVGFGLVPDPRYGDSSPASDSDDLVAFRVEDAVAPSPSLLVQLDALRLAWSVIRADGRVTEAEVWRLEDRLAADSRGDDAGRVRVLAANEWHKLRVEVPSPSSSTDIHPELADAPEEVRQSLGRLLVALACSDADLAESELDAIRVAFRSLNLPEQGLGELVRAFAPALAIAPVVEVVRVDDEVPPQTASSSETLLGSPSVGQSALPVQAQADATVGAVDASPSAAEVTWATDGSGGIGAIEPPGWSIVAVDGSAVPTSGLGDAVLTILQSLLDWETLDLEHARWLARRSDLMWGDVSETINNAALDRTGELAIEETDDKVRVYADVIRSLLS